MAKTYKSVGDMVKKTSPKFYKEHYMDIDKLQKARERVIRAAKRWFKSWKYSTKESAQELDRAVDALNRLEKRER